MPIWNCAMFVFLFVSGFAQSQTITDSSLFAHSVFRVFSLIFVCAHFFSPFVVGRLLSVVRRLCPTKKKCRETNN